MRRAGLFCLLASTVVAALLLGYIHWTPEAIFVRSPALPETTLLTATDLHYLSPELTDGGRAFTRMVDQGDGKMVGDSTALLEALVWQTIREAPDALILSGDLTFNGEAASHRELAAGLRRIEAAGIPVFVLPGNHDLENPMAMEYRGSGCRPVESLTAGQFAELYRDFGYGEAFSRDEASLSYVAALSPELRLLFVDANTAAAPGSLSEETLRWAEKQLQDAAESGAWVVAVSHQPLLDHGLFLTDGFVMGQGKGLLRLYESYPVIASLCGHIHLQHTAVSAGGLPEFATGALSVTPDPIARLKLEGFSASYQAIPLDVSGTGDPDLYDFACRSRQTFWETSFRQAVRACAGVPEADDLAAFFAAVNTAYFSGRMDQAAWDTDLYDHWQSLSGPLAEYLSSIAEDGFRDHTSYDFFFWRGSKWTAVNSFSI